MSAVIDDQLMPAWDDGVRASQATFRCVLDALAEPGIVRTLPVEVTGPSPLHDATTALCLALLDFDTPVWRDAAIGTASVASYLRFHCGSPLTEDPGASAFALVGNPADLDLSVFAKGSMEYPDRSTTLLIQVYALDGGPARVLSGPGIPGTRTLRVTGLPPDFDAQWDANAAAFPLGVDIVFCCRSQIIGLPRTTRIDQPIGEPPACT